MYSDDLVNWLMSIADTGSDNCPVYNVGSDEVITIQELAKKVAKNFQVGVARSKSELDGIDRYIPCIHKAKTDLNLSLNWGLDESLKTTIMRIKNEKNKHS